MNDADRLILDHFARVRNRTIAMVERIPDEWLDRTPEGERWTLRRHLAHITDGPDWWMTRVMKDGGKFAGQEPYLKDRTSLLEGLQATRDRVLRFFQADDDERMAQTFTFEEEGEVAAFTGRDRVLYLTDHEIHHRGRILLALLQWGITDLPGEDWLWPAME